MAKPTTQIFCHSVHVINTPPKEKAVSSIPNKYYNN